MEYFRIYAACFCLLASVTVCRSECDKARECLTELQNFNIATGTCAGRVKVVARIASCFTTHIVDCSTAEEESKKAIYNPIIATFQESCSEGCTDMVTQAADIHTTCLPEITEVLDDAVIAWNSGQANLENSEFKTRIECIKSKLLGAAGEGGARCSILRKYYGQLLMDNRQMAMLEQLYQLYDEPNSDTNPLSPIIPQNCDQTQEKLEEIADKCKLDRSNLYKDGHLINNFCVPIQDQLDCITTYESTCPDAVYKYEKMFIESYSVIHTVFCNNITLHGILINSIGRCTRAHYDDIYQTCWKDIIKYFSPNDKSFDTLDAYSFDAILVWAFRESLEGKTFCELFRDTHKFNTGRLAQCIRNFPRTKCSYALPTHGTTYPIPQGRSYDETLYQIILSSMTPFNEYGAYFLNVQRSQLCYPGCADYKTDDANYISQCQNKLRNAARKLVTDNLTDKKEKSTDCAADYNCTLAYSHKCPLFESKIAELYYESDMDQAGKVCNITKLDTDDIYPDNFYLKTTTLPPVPTTSYWNPSSTVTKDSTTGADAIRFSSYMWIPLLASLLLSVSTAL